MPKVVRFIVGRLMGRKSGRMRIQSILGGSPKTRRRQRCHSTSGELVKREKNIAVSKMNGTETSKRFHCEER